MFTFLWGESYSVIYSRQWISLKYYSHKISLTERSDFQFTYTLRINRIFSFVKKKLQWFMCFLLIPAVTEPDICTLKLFECRFKICFPELLINLSMSCCGRNIGKRGSMKKMTLWNCSQLNSSQYPLKIFLTYCTNMPIYI